MKYLLKHLVNIFVVAVIILMFLFALGVAHAATPEVSRVHLDAYDVPLLVPGGDLAPACVVDLHEKGKISTMAFVGFCTDVLPEIKGQMENDGATTIVTLSINGHNINLT